MTSLVSAYQARDVQEAERILKGTSSRSVRLIFFLLDYENVIPAS
jgi:hypothetical protein